MMMQCKAQHVPEELLGSVVGWALPATRHLWGDTLELDDPGRINSEILELLPMAHVCQAWRAAVQPHIWKHTCVATVRGIHRLELLARLPWLAHLIKNVVIELHWDAAFDDSGSAGNWHSEIRGEQAEYFFCDRQAVLNRLIAAGHVTTDTREKAYYEDGQLLEFSQGPDGTGFFPFIKTADDAIKSLESSILRLQGLQRLVWQTAILPMPSSVCLHLSQLDSLRLLRLEQQGEFRSSRRLPAPLWEIFGPNRQLDGISLGIRVLPQYTNKSSETAFDDESHTLRRAIRHEYVDAEIPMLHPEHLFSRNLKEVPPMERPLAMATSLLEACANQGSVPLVCLVRDSECLLRFRHLAHMWVKLPVTTRGAMLDYGWEPHFDRWMSAANGMRQALMEIASEKDDRKLSASDIASLPDGRDVLDPFAAWLRDDQQVQRRVAAAWNSLVKDGQDLEVPRAFSVQVVNGHTKSSDDHWLYMGGLDYGPV